MPVASSTSPARVSCTCAALPPRWPACSCWARAKASTGRTGRSTPFRVATCRSPRSGTLILWLGWFGFNGGSQLQVTGVDNANAVALIFVNTNMAAASGLVFALLLSRLWFGKADLTMALNGALAGLVAITAEPLTPSAA